MKSISSKKTHKQLSKEEEERLTILSKSDSVEGLQLTLTEEGLKTEEELKRFALGIEDNPIKKHEIYYTGIEKLLKKYLPKGDNNKRVREIIREEKKTFLALGKRIKSNGKRGGDSRMGYMDDQQKVLDLIISWIISKGTPVELYLMFRELNESRGYI